MASYKVIQDIEAEDKLIGPLTLRQFIYAAIVLVCGFIAFKFGELNIFLVIPFVPVMLFFGLLAAPLGRDQPNEIWLLARIRFFLKPRLRKWDQSGAYDPVTITIPKKIERRLTKDYTAKEARSRLQALANTIDTRGWAIKNVDVNLFSQPSYLADQEESDRLIDPSALPKEVSNLDITPQDDIYEENNPSSQHINEILSASEQANKKYYKDLAANGPATDDQVKPDYWFLNQTQPPSNAPAGYKTFRDDDVVAPGADDDQASTVATSFDDDSIDPALADKVLHAHEKSRNLENANMHILDPLSAKKNTANPIAQTAVTSHTDNANISAWAGDNNLSVASLAHIANEEEHKDDSSQEVVISLH